MLENQLNTEEYGGIIEITHYLRPYFDRELAKLEGLKASDYPAENIEKKPRCACRPHHAHKKLPISRTAP